MNKKVNNLRIENYKYFKETIMIIAETPGITHGELAEKLNVSSSNLSESIKKFSEHEPPLIEKGSCGKFRSYELTPDGKAFYRKLTKPEQEEGTELTYKKDIMMYILETQENNQNPYVQLLRSINIEMIDEEFTLPEFTILCKVLGIIPQEQIIEKDLEQSLNCWGKIQSLIEKDIEMQKKQVKKDFPKMQSTTKD